MVSRGADGSRRVRFTLAIAALTIAIVGLGVTGGAVGESGATSDGLGGTTTERSPTNDTASVCVVVFESPGCPACGDVRTHLDSVSADHDVRVVDYVAGEHPEHYDAYLRAYDVPERHWGSVPIVFVGGQYAVGSDASIALIDEALATDGGVACPSLESGGTTGGVASVDRSTVLTLLGLAIGDAVNPCALAVLVILLTTIVTRDGDPRDVLTAGVSFALAVGATYLLLGVLLVFGLKSIASIASLQTLALREVFGLLAIAVGLVNLVDGLSSGARGFAVEVPESWRPTMQRYLTRPLWTRRSRVVGSVLAGIAVSLFLVPCTAGPYLVAGGMLASVPWSGALPLLALYNFVFVLPMLGVTLLVYGGFTSADAVGSWRTRNRDTLQLVAGTVLVVLGALLAAGYI